MTKELTVLLVDDYEPLRSDMAEVLEDLFERVVTAEDGNEALKLYREHHNEENSYFDLVITDIQMPGMDGVKLCESLRDIRADQPIIVMSAHTESANLLRLINIGIAQFLTKPINNDELMNTLYNVSKDINTAEDDVNTLLVVDMGENCIWDKEKHFLKQDNNIVDLTKNEQLLLDYLIRKSNQVCTNEDITEEFYAHNVDIYEKSIRNLVFRLRKKLPDNTISSIYGMGYKFSNMS